MKKATKKELEERIELLEKNSKITGILSNFLFKLLNEKEGFLSEFENTQYICWNSVDGLRISKSLMVLSEKEKELYDKNGGYVIINMSDKGKKK